jgi:MYXO-CTERM domain-containing protein
MLRALLVTIMALVGTHARAQLLIQFQFTNDPIFGDVAGTVTGLIEGLQDNATSAATHVYVERYPAGLSATPTPIDFADATVFPVQQANSFTVANGVVTSATFLGAGTGLFDILAISYFQEDELSVGTSGLDTVIDESGFSGVTFSTVEEPASAGLVLVGVLGLWLARRSRPWKAAVRN